MTKEQYYEFGVVNRYIQVLTAHYKAALAIANQISAMKERNKELDRQLEKAKADMERIKKPLGIWEAREKDLIQATFGKEYLIPSFK